MTMDELLAAVRALNLGDKLRLLKELKAEVAREDPPSAACPDEDECGCRAGVPPEFDAAVQRLLAGYKEAS